MSRHRLFLLLFAAAFGAAGCSSSGLSGGGKASKGSTKESGKEEKESQDPGGSGQQTSTDTDQEIGEDDSGDFAFPEDVAGSYLACVSTGGMTGQADFSCGVHKNGKPDPRVLSAVTQGTLLGTEALKVATLEAQLEPATGKIRVTLTGNGQAPGMEQVPFGLSVSAAFTDGTTSTLDSPYALFIPPALFGNASCPEGYVGQPSTLADGRTFKVCTAQKGAGGAIEAIWTRFPGTDEENYVASFVRETAAGCDLSQKVSANFNACSCEKSEEWIKGTISIPASGNPFEPDDICLVVDTELTIFGKKKPVYSTSH